MLPLFQYLVSILLWAPAVLHVAFKRPLSYESILSLLLISSALNVVIGMKTFGKGYGVAVPQNSVLHVPEASFRESERLYLPGRPALSSFTASPFSLALILCSMRSRDTL